MARDDGPFLTVEEAARRLRIGRTLAYQLASRYQSTGGAEGLPVVQLGSVLRVPRARLEELAGGRLDDPEPTSVVDLEARRESASEPRPRRTRRARRTTPTSEATQSASRSPTIRWAHSTVNKLGTLSTVTSPPAPGAAEVSDPDLAATSRLAVRLARLVGRRARTGRRRPGR